MPTLNGDQAVSAALARITNQPGGCLATVWQFYGSHPSTGPHAGQYPDAIDGWAYATRRHPGDFHPPAGYPVYFDALPRPRYAGDDNYPSGDVVISIGGGLVRCTDGAGAGRMGTMTIAQRAAQIGRVYLGWTEDFLGYDVVTTAGAALNATPISTTPTGDEFDMASLADLKTIVTEVVNAAAADIKSSVRREERARLYYCPNPPAGLPNFVAIFWDREEDNILYANDGETQARNWNTVYYQTADTVEQAKAAAVSPDQLQKLVAFAQGKDTAFTNSRAAQ